MSGTDLREFFQRYIDALNTHEFQRIPSSFRTSSS